MMDLTVKDSELRKGLVRMRHRKYWYTLSVCVHFVDSIYRRTAKVKGRIKNML